MLLISKKGNINFVESIVLILCLSFRYQGDKRGRVGGFDLVYNDGPVKHERTSNYSSYLGKISISLYAPTTNVSFRLQPSRMLPTYSQSSKSEKEIRNQERSSTSFIGLANVI